MAFVGALGVVGRGRCGAVCDRAPARGSVRMLADWGSSEGSSTEWKPNTGVTGAGSDGGHLEKIEFLIRPDGRVEQKVIGVKGGQCLEITKKIEESLGKVVSQEKTNEYYEVPNQQVNNVVQQDLPTW